jgi:hypothetical protein
MLGCRDQRHPQVKPRGKVKALGHHADNRCRSAIDLNRRANNVGAFAEAALPDVIVQDGHRRGAGDFIGWRKVPPEHRGHSKQPEGVGTDRERRQVHQVVTGVSESDFPFTDKRESLKCVGLRVPGLEIRVRDTAAATRKLFLQIDHAVVLFHQRIAAHQERAHDREHRDVQRNGQRERANRRAREGPVASEATQGESQIVKESFQPRQPSRVAMRLL